MIEKYFNAINAPLPNERTTISKNNLKQLLQIRLDKAHSVQDLEKVIINTRNQFENSLNDEMYIGNVFQGIYNPSIKSLDAKKDYIMNNFPDYFLTE